jgi:hypothetical protein
MPTSTAADRALYVDYECSKDRPPTLLGIQDEDHIRQAVVEPLFHPCAARRRVQRTVAADHLETVRDLVARADREERHIVSWSEFDRDHMRTVLAGRDADLERLDRWWVNAIPIARRWRWKVQPDLEVERHRLAFYLKGTGYYVPERFGEGVAGAGLRAVRRQLEQGRTYSDLSKGAKTQWRAVVRHNQFDCDGMRHAVRQFVTETGKDLPVPAA